MVLFLFYLHFFLEMSLFGIDSVLIGIGDDTGFISLFEAGFKSSVSYSSVSPSYSSSVMLGLVSVLYSGSSVFRLVDA